MKRDFVDLVKDKEWGIQDPGGSTIKFTIHELKATLANKIETAPGLNDITYSTMKKLPIEEKECLIKFYFSSVKHNIVPRECIITLASFCFEEDYFYIIYCCL